VADPDRLADLDQRLNALKTGQLDDAPHVEEHYSAAQVGWRMVIELVAGLGIGLGVGYGLDSLFGTMPIFLVLFTFLGLAAGIRVMLESAKEMQRTQMGAAVAAPDDDERA